MKDSDEGGVVVRSSAMGSECLVVFEGLELLWMMEAGSVM
jgi:hypothetical protein